MWFTFAISHFDSELIIQNFLIRSSNSFSRRAILNSGDECVARILNHMVLWFTVANLHLIKIAQIVSPLDRSESDPPPVDRTSRFMSGPISGFTGCASHRPCLRTRSRAFFFWLLQDSCKLKVVKRWSNLDCWMAVLRAFIKATASIWTFGRASPYLATLNCVPILNSVDECDW